jgi:membrane protein EpsK
MKSSAWAEELVEVSAALGQAPQTARAGRSFLVNTAANASFTGTNALANLWLTSFLIGHLGIAVYGMVPLVASLTAMFAVLTTALDTALSRFLVLEVQRGDDHAANEVFNTALFGLTGIILALTPLVIGLVLAFPRLFNTPAGSEQDARVLFALVALASFATVLGSSFSVSPFIYSQFVRINLVNLLALALRIGFIAAAFTWFAPRLWYTGAGALLGALICLLGFVLLWRRYTPALHIRRADCTRARMRPLLSMGGWTVVNTLGVMLLSRVDLIVVNAFFGPAMTGGYGSVVQLALLMEYMVTAAGTVIRPIILIKYAQQDFGGLQRIAGQGIKLLGLALALPVGLLCGFSEPLLAAWLGPEYRYLGILLILLMFHQSVNLAMRPLLFVQTAYNRVKWPGIATLLSGVGSLALAIALVQWAGWGVAGVAIGVAATWTAKNVIYVPIYTAHIMDLPWTVFLVPIVPIAAATTLVGGASYALADWYMPDGWLRLGLAIALVSVLYLAAVWRLGLNAADRRLVRDLLPV